MYRPHCVRSVLKTSVKILAYRPLARLMIRAKQWPPEVILKSLLARASRAVLGFRIPHMFNLLKLDNVAKIIEVSFACPLSLPLPWSGFHRSTCDSKSVWCFFRNVNISCESKQKESLTYWRFSHNYKGHDCETSGCR